MATDLEIRNQGFKYIPQQQYLQNPFQLQTTETEDTEDPGGITSIPQGGPYMGYPSYAAYLAAQRGGGDGGGQDDDDTPTTTGTFDWSNFPSLINLARRAGTWGVDKFTDWNEGRKEKKQAEIDMSHKIEGRSFRPGGAGSPESQQGGAPGTPKGEGGWKGAYGGIVGLAQGGRIGLLYGGNPNEERSHSLAGTHAGENAAKGGTNDDGGIKKKLNISPFINKVDDTPVELGAVSDTKLGQLRAMIDFRNLNKALTYGKEDDTVVNSLDDVRNLLDPSLSFNTQIGPIDVNAYKDKNIDSYGLRTNVGPLNLGYQDLNNQKRADISYANDKFNIGATTDFNNINLGATYNKGPFTVGGTMDDMGNWNTQAGLQWAFNNGGLVGIL